MNSHYYSKLELCGGVVTVSFLKYLPWQVMYFLQCSTHFLKMHCRPSDASFGKIVKLAVLTFHVHLLVSKVLPPLENNSSSHSIISTSWMGELQDFRIQLRNADAPLRKYLVTVPS
jgi:hypothetical protein